MANRRCLSFRVGLKSDFPSFIIKSRFVSIALVSIIFFPLPFWFYLPIIYHQRSHSIHDTSVSKLSLGVSLIW